MSELLVALRSDLAAEPLWVQLWIVFMALILILSVPLSFQRIEARWMLLALIGSSILMFILYAIYGYERILGLPHIIFWTPMVAYLWQRRSFWNVKRTWFGKWVFISFCIMIISLAFDVSDVARFFWK